MQDDREVGERHRCPRERDPTRLSEGLGGREEVVFPGQASGRGWERDRRSQEEAAAQRWTLKFTGGGVRLFGSAPPFVGCSGLELRREGERCCW